MTYQVRNVGMAATLFPRMKRAVGHLINTGGFDSTVFLVPDANAAASGGDDESGTGAIYLYKSATEEFFPDRTEWAVAATIAPAVTAVSETQAFIGAMAIRDSTQVPGKGDTHVVYVGSDNSLRHVYIDYNPDTDTYGSQVAQTIVAGNAVTNRFRAVDISVERTSGNPAVAVYEADASSGQGAYIRVYIRNNDGTTWRKAYEVQIMTSEFIRENSEDVSISWGALGLESNVGRLALYYTNTRQDGDQGDTLVELSYNTSTGTDGSASVVTTWETALHQNVAAGNRRGWLYQAKFSSTSVWVFGAMVGLAAPFYMAARLRSGVTAYHYNKSSGSPSDILNRNYQVITSPDLASSALRTSTYSDDRLVFAFVGPGIGASSSAVRAVVFRWSDENPDEDTCVAIDTASRVWDGAPTDTPLAVYGGQDRRDTGVHKYTFLVGYGAVGTNISSNFARRFEASFEHTFPAPDTIFPVGVVIDKNKPTLQVSVTSPATYPNIKGRLQFTIASNPGFSTDVVTFEEPETEYRIFENTIGPNGVPQYVTYEADASLVTGEWYWRPRIQSDLGAVSSWGGVFGGENGGSQFSILHRPSPGLVYPALGSAVPYKDGRVSFTWTFSDSEPTDTQSAYQVVVTRTDTNEVVIDTTKVVSSLTTAVLEIPSTLNGIPLKWTVKVWDSDDTPSFESEPITFVMYLPPVVLIVSPTDGGTLSSSSPVVSWTFTAAGRVQTHYRVLIQNIDVNPYEDVADSGWVAGNSASHIFSSAVLAQGVNYRVVVYVRDSVGMIVHSESNLVSNFGFEQDVEGWTATNSTIIQSAARYHEGYKSALWTPSGGGTPLLESPTFPVVENREYTAYFWGFSVAGWADARIGIDWRDEDDVSISVATDDTMLGANVWTRVELAATAPAGAVGARLQLSLTGSPSSNDKVWVDEVYLKHSPIVFGASWTPPSDGDISVTADEFKVTISWTNGNIDPDFVAWRVYRKYNKYSSDLLDVENSRNTWVMIYETTEVEEAYEYRDYFAPLNKEIQYIVVQVVDRDGSLVESSISAPATVTVVGDRYYFVPYVPVGSIASFEAHFVTGDIFTRETERNVANVAGRGRQVQLGDDLGYNGTLTLRLRDPNTARADREFIELLSAQSTGKVYIRSPFGDVVLVNFGNPQFSRMPGVGLGDLGDLTIPYLQVYDEPIITRTSS